MSHCSAADCSDAPVPPALDFDLSLAGCGFLGIYHVGVAAAFRQYVPRFAADRRSVVSACSAGGLVGACLICGCCLGQATSDTLQLVIQARAHTLGPLQPSFDLMDIVRRAMEHMLPANAHTLCSGRLRLSLTRFSDGKNVIVEQFDSNDELIDALICSSFIPFYCGTSLPTFRHVHYMDGGFSVNQPVVSDRTTVTVSPFSGEADICPRDEDSDSLLTFAWSRTSFRCTARNLYRVSVAFFPPHPEIMSRMCEQGFEDALRYMARNELIACMRCMAVHACILTQTGGTALGHTDRTDTAASPPADSAAGRAVFALDDEPTEEVDWQEELVRQSPPIAAATVPTRLSRLRSSKSAPALARQHRHGAASSSQCDQCRETIVRSSNRLVALPDTLRHPLAKAEAAERTWLNWLLASRPVNALRIGMLVWQVPVQYALRLVRRVPVLPGDALWLCSRATSLLRYVYAAVQTQRHLYSNTFTCHMDITELYYGDTVAQQQQPSHPCEPGPAPAECTQHWDEAEARFGLQFDLGAQSKPARDYMDMVAAARDGAGVAVSHVAHATENLAWAGLHAQQQQHHGHYAESAPPPPPHAEQSTVDSAASSTDGLSLNEAEVDTLATIIEYTRRHEALMQWHYLDEHGQMKVTEIYGVSDAGGGACAATAGHSEQQQHAAAPSAHHSGHGAEQAVDRNASFPTLRGLVPSRRQSLKSTNTLNTMDDNASSSSDAERRPRVRSMEGHGRRVTFADQLTFCAEPPSVSTSSDCEESAPTDAEPQPHSAEQRETKDACCSPIALAHESSADSSERTLHWHCGSGGARSRSPLALKHGRRRAPASSGGYQAYLLQHYYRWQGGDGDAPAALHTEQGGDGQPDERQRHRMDLANVYRGEGTPSSDDNSDGNEEKLFVPHRRSKANK